MDRQLIQGLLSQLAGAIGLTGGAPTRTSHYTGSGGYYAGNIMNYQPNMLTSIAQMVFPAIGRQAPQNMLHQRWMEVLGRSDQRARLEQRLSGYNPLAVISATRGLERMGFKGARGLFIDRATGQPTMMGNMLSQAWNMTAGPLLGDETADRGRQAGLLYDTLAGITMTRRGRMPQMGLRSNEVEDLMGNLAGRTYRDPKTGLFRKGRFNLREMVDIARMGADYGMLSGVDPKDLGKRVEQLSEVVATGLSVYGTLYKSMKKEEVIQKVMELTAGTLPITETASAGQLLMKVDALAKQAHVSVEVMHRLMSEGAKVYGQLGYTGTTGAMMAAGTYQRAQLLRQGFKASDVGMGKTPELARPVLTARELAAAGGMSGTQAALEMAQTAWMGSSQFKNTASLLQMAQDVGVNPKTVQQYFTMSGEPGGLNVGARNSLLNLIKARYKATAGPGLSDAAADREVRRLLKQNQQYNTNRFTEGVASGRFTIGTGPQQRSTDIMDIQRRGRIAQVTEAIAGVTPDDSEERRRLMLRGEEFAKLTTGQREQLLEQKRAVVQQFYQKNFGWTEAQARVVAKESIRIFQGGANDPYFRLARMRMRDATASALEARATEREARGLPRPMERLWNVIKRESSQGVGEYIKALLPQEEVLSLINMKDVAAGKTIFDPELIKKRELTPKALAAVENKLLQVLPWMYDPTTRGAYAGMKLLTGRSSFSVAKGMSQFKTLRGIMEDVGSTTRADAIGKLGKNLGIAAADREGFATQLSEFFDKRDLNMASMEEFIKGQGYSEQYKKAPEENMKNMLALLRGSNKGKYDTFMRDFQDTRQVIENIRLKSGGKGFEEILKERGIPELIRVWKAGTADDAQKDRIKASFRVSKVTTFADFAKDIALKSQKAVGLAAEEQKALRKKQVDTLVEDKGILLAYAKKGLTEISDRKKRAARHLLGFEKESDFREFATQELETLSQLAGKPEEKRAKGFRKFIGKMQQRLEERGTAKTGMRMENMVNLLQAMMSTAGTGVSKKLLGTFSAGIQKAEKEWGINTSQKIAQASQETANNTKQMKEDLTAIKNNTKQKTDKGIPQHTAKKPSVTRR